MFILMLNQWFMGMEGAGLNHLAARASKFVDVCIMRSQVRASFDVRIYSRRLNQRRVTFTEENKTKISILISWAALTSTEVFVMLVAWSRDGSDVHSQSQKNETRITVKVWFQQWCRDCEEFSVLDTAETPDPAVSPGYLKVIFPKLREGKCMGATNKNSIWQSGFVDFRA